MTNPKPEELPPALRRLARGLQVVLLAVVVFASISGVVNLFAHRWWQVVFAATAVATGLVLALGNMSPTPVSDFLAISAVTQTDERRRIMVWRAQSAVFFMIKAFVMLAVIAMYAAYPLLDSPSQLLLSVGITVWATLTGLELGAKAVFVRIM